MQSVGELEDSLLTFRATGNVALLTDHIEAMSGPIADAEDPELIAAYARLLSAKLLSDPGLALNEHYGVEIAKLRAAAFRLRIIAPVAPGSLLVEGLLCVLRLRIATDPQEQAKHQMRARRYFENAIKIDPTNPEIALALGRFELSTPVAYGGNHARGRAVLDSLKGHPRYSEVVQNILSNSNQ